MTWAFLFFLGEFLSRGLKFGTIQTMPEKNQTAYFRR